MGDELNAVVIDNGSGICKAGIAGDDVPKACFPSVVGRPRFPQMTGTEGKDEFIGNDVIPKRGIVNMMQGAWKLLYNLNLKYVFYVKLLFSTYLSIIIFYIPII